MNEANDMTTLLPPCEGLTLRFVREGDEKLLLSLILELAEYEKMTADVTATEAILHESFFVEHAAEAILAHEGDELVGYVIFFHNFSTFTGKKGLYLEDLFVRPAHRGKGYGKALLLMLARLAHMRGCSRMEWACLDWNQPSIDFYEAMSARRQKEWLIFRFDEDALEKHARNGKDDRAC